MFQRRNKTSDFLGNEDGTILIIFGFALVAFLGLVGLTVDGGRAMTAKNKTVAALDSAALATTREMFQNNPTDGELVVIAQEFFRRNTELGATLDATYDNFQMSIDRNTKTVTLAADTHVPTYFGRVFGLQSIDFTTSTQATFNVRDIELGMALDVTGSMNERRKIDDLKDAAKELVDILIPDRGSVSDVKIGIAPYSASVNAGPYAARITNGASSDDCTIERTGADAYTDAEPIVAGRYLGAATPGQREIDPTEGIGRYGSGSCPAAQVIAITNDKGSLKSTIDTYRAGGPTAGHIGAAWGWYLVSPEWSDIWPDAPRPYGTKNLIKAVVLMTDGIFNTSYYNDTAAAQAIRLCDNMKSEGVIVYTVGFRAPSGAADTLRNCASVDTTSGDKLFYDAADGDELRTAFRDIAVKLTSLRLDK